MTKFFIYKIVNKINGKMYIGQHVSTKDKDLYFGSGFILKKAIKKYGKENFCMENIEECFSYEELNEREIFWIKELNTLVPDGYNIREGGNNAPMSDSSKEKLKISLKGKAAGDKNPNFNGKITGQQIVKDKISNGMKAKYINDPEFKNKVSKTGKKMPVEFGPKHSENIKGDKNPMYIKVSQDTIDKIIFMYDIEKYGLVEISDLVNLSCFKIRKILTDHNIPIIKNQFKKRHYF